MLPEQVQLLKELREQQMRKTKPILDEDRRTEIDIKIRRALENNLTVKINYFENHDFHEMNSKLLKVNVIDKKVFLKENEKDFIWFMDIIDIEIIY